MMGEMERLDDEDATKKADEDDALEEFGSFEEEGFEDELEDDSMEPFEAGPNTREQFEEDEEPEEKLWLEDE